MKKVVITAAILFVCFAFIQPKNDPPESFEGAIIAVSTSITGDGSGGHLWFRASIDTKKDNAYQKTFDVTTYPSTVHAYTDYATGPAPMIVRMKKNEYGTYYITETAVFANDSAIYDLFIFESDKKKVRLSDYE